MKVAQTRKLKKKSKHEHGGEYAIGKRKAPRPLTPKKPTHLVLKSNRVKALNVSFVKRRNLIEKIIRLQAERAMVRVYSVAVVGNHLHLAIYFKERIHYIRFIRAVTGHLILSLSKEFKKSLKGLFDLLPYTRIVEWGLAYKRLLNYIAINNFESQGVVFEDRTEWVLESAPNRKGQLTFI